MFSRILVPLDGSKLAQRALDHAAAMAEKFSSEIILLQVMHLVPTFSSVSPDSPVPVDFPAIEERERAQIEHHLGDVLTQLTSRGIQARVAIERGDPAQKIAEFVDREQIGLVVMSSHGRSGLARWVYGSVAEKVLHHVNCPMMLIRITKDDLKASTS